MSEESGVSAAAIYGWKAKLKNGTLSVMGIESSSNERTISLLRPELGRFTTVDPIRDGMNWYVYTGNDPVNYVDLWGLEFSTEGLTEEEKDLLLDAKKYLEENSPTAKALIEKLKNSEEVFTIELNDKDKNTYNPGSNTISWDPSTGLNLGDKDGDGVDDIVPPVVVLAHEGGHGAQDIDGIIEEALKDGFTEEERLESENKNLEQHEIPISQELGLEHRDHYLDLNRSNPRVDMGSIYPDKVTPKCKSTE